MHASPRTSGSIRPRVVCLALVSAVSMMLVGARASVATEDCVGTYTGGLHGDRVSFVRHDHPRDAWAGTLGLRLDSGEDVVGFCIQLDVTIGGTRRYRCAGAVENLPNGCEIRYILEHFPGSTATDDTEAAARQMAIWHYSDGVDLTTIADGKQAIRDRAIAIADAAQAGSCPPRRSTAPGLSLLPASVRVPFGQRVLYTARAEAFDARQPIHVAVTGPAALDDGAQDTTLTLDDSGAVTFGVTATGVGTSTLSVELPYRLEAGIVLSQLDDGPPSQRLVMAQHIERVARAAAEATWDEAPTATPVPTTAVPTTAVPTTAAPTTPAPTTPAPTATPIAATATGPVTTATSRPTSRQREATPVVTAAPATTPVVPASLPRTGASIASPGWPAAVGAALLAIGWAARRLAGRGRPRRRS